MDYSAFLLMVILLAVPESHTLTLEIDQETETAAIISLRNLEKKLQLTAPYMEEDFYLRRWLAVNDFNVDAALQQLQEHLQWREFEKVDHILEEDWTELNSILPYTRRTKDKKGRPLLYFELGQWDISKFSEEHSFDSLGRYFVKMLEESHAHVRQLRAEGNNNITQFQMLLNLDEFSMKKHCCFKFCSIGKTLATHFPRSTEKKVFINVPPLFELVYLFLGDETQKLIKVYGQDRSIWELVLLEYIDRDQIPGNLVTNSDKSVAIELPQ